MRITAPREAVGCRRPEALEDKVSKTIATKQTDGLPEPMIKNEKDKLEIKIDVSEYK